MSNIVIDMNNIPKHIALILDGNGRWAKKRMLPRNLGHRKGAFNIADIAKEASALGIKVMSCYCFSTENWNRPKQEVDYLMQVPIKYFKRYKEKIENSDIKVIFSGRRDRVPSNLLTTMEEIEKITSNHEGLILNLCFDYGSHDEIINAAKKLAIAVKNGEISVDQIDEKMFEKNLYTKDLPPVDLLIRTSGEERISNYLLWQIAYAEFYFTPVLWPDFDAKELEKAIISYQGRTRRFGGLKEEEK